MTKKQNNKKSKPSTLSNVIRGLVAVHLAAQVVNNITSEIEQERKDKQNKANIIIFVGTFLVSFLVMLFTGNISTSVIAMLITFFGLSIYTELYKISEAIQ